MSKAASPRFYYKGDRLKPLRAFCQAARLGSISRAAEALFERVRRGPGLVDPVTLAQAKLDMRE